VPPIDAYAFRLVATRKLYDQGTLVQASSQLAGLAPGTAARINPYDADRLGVTAGDRVVLRSARTSLTLPVHPDTGVPRSAVALVLNQVDARVGDLIAVDGPVTELHIETAS
jgi:anaerobic selenocysteine-containing dehydrogenase